MVVGAGRGPLIRALLNAATNTLRQIKIYVVEKNPCAIITLSALIKGLWPDKDITLFSCDMRDLVPPEKVDILVSELMGAFGDNELSPECLDGAQRHLKPNGISIPSRSTSYINPIMSSKLYNLVRYSEHAQHPRESRQPYQAIMEKMCTAFLNNVYHIDEPQPVFTFDHPNMCVPIDNRRFKMLRFNASTAAVLHGFAGYFDAVLYDDIKISIHPMSLSTGMFSWFPVFFSISVSNYRKCFCGNFIKRHFYSIGTDPTKGRWYGGAPFLARCIQVQRMVRMVRYVSNNHAHSQSGWSLRFCSHVNSYVTYFIFC